MEKVKKLSILLVGVMIYTLSYSQMNMKEMLEGNCGITKKVAVYGEDNREEYCSQNIIRRSLANSVAALFKNYDGSIVKDGNYYRFGKKTLRDKGVAHGQRFAYQPSLSFCTGFLVGDDLLATAGHCIKDERINPKRGEYCENIKIVFGYRMELGGVIPREIDEENVYSCKSVVAHSYGGGKADYAVIRLDRKVEDRSPLPINRGNKELKKGTPLFVIGHPSGLPLKIADKAEVIRITDIEFVANLDTFAGNSGSPVINAKTLLVEGILVRGRDDYIPNPEDPSTVIVATYPYKPADGIAESATKISVVEDFIPVTKIEKDMIELNKRAKGNLYETLLENLKKSVEEYNRRHGIIEIPNFDPDGNGGVTVKPAIYYIPEPPKPNVGMI